MPNLKDLEKLKDLIHLDPATLKFVAPLILNSIIPKVVHVGGKYISTAGLVDKIVADGHIGLEDLPILIEAWFSGVEADPSPHAAPPVLVVPLPVPATGTPWKPPTGSGPVAPAAPSALSMVSALGIEFELQDTLENNRAPIAYTLTETPEAYEITLVNHGTTNFPLHGGAYLHAVYLDAQGIPINFEQRGLPELYNTAIWEASSVDGAGINTLAFDKSLGRYNQTDKGAHIANWNNEAEQPKEATRTGGMDVPVHFPDDANERVIDITLMLPTGVKAKPIRFPKVS